MDYKAVEIQAVAQGAEFCACGGMMRPKEGGGVLMSNPPKVEIECPFCGVNDYVLHPYEIKIEFKEQQE